MEKTIDGIRSQNTVGNQGIWRLKYFDSTAPSDKSLGNEPLAEYESGQWPR